MGSIDSQQLLAINFLQDINSVYTPDIHVLLYDIHGHVISILLSDIKPTDMEKARLETEAYAVSSHL